MMKLGGGSRNVFGRKLAEHRTWKWLKRKRVFQVLAGTEGSQLVEFSLSLPLLLVFLVGIVQFSGAFNLKQKMANAAREGTRIMISNVVAGSGCSGTDCSAQAAVGAMANYMTNAGVDSSCINPSALTSVGTQSWMVRCGNGITMTVNHQYVYTLPDGTPVSGTEVSITYPYTWFFDDVMGLLLPGAKISLPKTLTETAVMQNIAN